ncbi:unnamed protein product [Psylliodes chrysocephalus]|uniref:Cytochrome P450 n=1 Tax=Psylliodes chrysocephalus TaxID=3402493 RepID=A0A9P0CJV4_9CUCU|nr:unnamed protein product [Psylliodes chrysocephala]
MRLIGKFNIGMSKSLNTFITDLKYNFQETLILIFFVLLLFRFIEYLWQNRNLFKRAWNIQGPLNLPIIGSSYLFFRNPAGYMKRMEKLHCQYPKIFKIWLGPNNVLFALSDPEYIKKLFTDPKATEKAFIYDVLTEVFGPGILTAPAKIWKPHRRAISPYFTKNRIDSFVKTFSEDSAKFVNQLREVGNNKDYDWSLFVKRYSLDVVCKSVMGMDLKINYVKHREDDLGHSIDMLNHYGIIKSLQVWYHVGMIYTFSTVKKKFEKYRELFNNITTSAVREKLHQLKDNDNADYAETETKKRRPDLIEMIYSNPIFTEQSLIYEVNTFLAAATDTTGMAICTTFLMLAMHPGIQQKVYDEVIDAIGLTEEIDPTGLVKMKYTERVIKETLRLFPPVVMFGRRLTGDINLGDIILPKGASAGLIPSLLHRDPKYWKDPLTFNPDRFLPEENSKRHPCTYIPFSYGARNCIGKYYAFQNLKTLTATVIREFMIYTAYKSVEEVEFTLQGVLTLTHGVKLWFEPRT